MFVSSLTNFEVKAKNFLGTDPKPVGEAHELAEKYRSVVGVIKNLSGGDLASAQQALRLYPIYQQIVPYDTTTLTAADQLLHARIQTWGCANTLPTA